MDRVGRRLGICAVGRKEPIQRRVLVRCQTTWGGCRGTSASRITTGGSHQGRLTCATWDPTLVPNPGTLHTE